MKRLLLAMMLLAAPAWCDSWVQVGSIATAVNDNPNTWTNRSFMLTENASVAVASIDLNDVDGAYTDKVQITGYAPGVPANATITGIGVRIRRRGTAAGAVPRDGNVQLIIAGTVTGNDKAVLTMWPTTLTDKTYGGDGDMWGTTLTAEQVNAGDFGVQVQGVNAQFDVAAGTMSIDVVEVTIYGTVPPGEEPPPDPLDEVGLISGFGAPVEDERVAPTTATGPVWRNSNPGGGGAWNYGMEIPAAYDTTHTLVTSSVMFMGGDVGGLWRSLNHGRSWTELGAQNTGTTSGFNRTSVISMDYDPRSDTLAANNATGIDTLRSGPKIVYAGIDGRFMRSIDKGLSWQACGGAAGDSGTVSTPEDWPASISVVKGHPDSVYLLTHVAFGDTSTFTSSSYAAVRLSTDRGLTWANGAAGSNMMQTAPTALPVNTRYLKIKAQPYAGNIVFLSTGFDRFGATVWKAQGCPTCNTASPKYKLLRSRDAGATWTDITPPAPATGQVVEAVMDWDFDPFHPDTMYCTTFEGDLRSASTAKALSTTANGTTTLTTTGDYFVSVVHVGDVITGGGAGANITVVSIQSATSLTMSATIAAAGEPVSRTFTRSQGWTGHFWTSPDEGITWTARSTRTGSIAVTGATATGAPKLVIVDTDLDITFTSGASDTTAGSFVSTTFPYTSWVRGDNGKGWGYGHTYLDGIVGDFAHSSSQRGIANSLQVSYADGGSILWPTSQWPWIGGPTGIFTPLFTDSLQSGPGGGKYTPKAKYNGRNIDNTVVTSLAASGDWIYGGAWDIGLWRSNDKGYSWQSCNDTVATGYGQKISLNAVVSGTPWIGHGGDTYTVLADPQSGTVWANNGTGKVTTSLVRSTRRGEPGSWAIVGAATVDSLVSGLSFNPRSAPRNRQVFACTNGDVAMSLDDGVTWAIINAHTRKYSAGSPTGSTPDTTAFRNTAVDYSGNLWAGGPGGLFKCTNPQAVSPTFTQTQPINWTIAVPSGSSFDFRHIGVHDLLARREGLYVTISGNGATRGAATTADSFGVWFTADAGTSWSKIHAGIYDDRFIVGPSGEYWVASRSVGVGGGLTVGQGLQRNRRPLMVVPTGNSGANWARAENGLPWPSFSPMLADPNGNFIMVGIPGGGFFRTDLPSRAFAPSHGGR